jgi:NMD protein affecting ribosome stability and mRNA decay
LAPHGEGRITWVCPRCGVKTQTTGSTEDQLFCGDCLMNATVSVKLKPLTAKPKPE